MFNPLKTDPELGLKVEANLQRLGIHTPTTIRLRDPESYKLDAIAEHTQAIMSVLGLDLEDDSLRDTPNRISKMYVREVMWGLIPENFPKFKAIENKMRYDEMLVERDITVMSLCEHHFVTIEGKATIAYIPKNKVAGLSKFNRVVEYFSRRPQVQERLTQQIFETLKFLLDTEDVAVLIEATHYCVLSRGVEDASSFTRTSCLGGIFRKPEVRQEFLTLATAPKK